jgi:ATP synthase protein I
MRQAQPAQLARAKAYKVVLSQVLVVVIAAALAWGFAGRAASSSLVLGGLACILPGVYFVKRFFLRVDARAAKQIVRTFYIGEMVKLILSAAIVVLLVRYADVRILPLMAGFGLAQLGFWVAPLFGV